MLRAISSVMHDSYIPSFTSILSLSVLGLSISISLLAQLSHMKA